MKILDIFDKKFENFPYFALFYPENIQNRPNFDEIHNF